MNIEINTGVLTDNFIDEISGTIPVIIQAALELDRQGMKFEGINKPSFIGLKDPKLLGEVVSIRDTNNKNITYVQIIYTFKCKENRND